MNRSKIILPFTLLFLLTVALPQANAITLEEINDTIQQILERAIQAGNNSKVIRDNMQRGLDAVTPEMLNSLDDALEAAKRALNEFNDGREVFLAGDCAAGTVCAEFRDNLIAFLTILETLANRMGGIILDGEPFDFSAARNTTQAAPAEALFPLWKVFVSATNTLNSKLIETMGAIGNDLTVLQESLGRPFAQEPGAVCKRVVENQVAVKRATYAVTGIGFYFRFIGKVMIGLGELNLDPDGGIHGYVHVTIKNNEIKKWAGVIDGLGVALGKFAAYAHRKLNECLIRDGHDQILAILQQFNPDLSNLDVAVSSRASQTSVNNIQFSVSALANVVASRSSQASVDELVLAVSNLASQVSLDDLTEEIDNNGSLGLRIQVERHLSGKDDTSIFYLPKTFGGLLEFVRDAVADTIAQNKAAGLPVGQAEMFFEDGNAAFSIGDYQGAFDNYRRAYQMVVNGGSLPPTPS